MQSKWLEDINAEIRGFRSKKGSKRKRKSRHNRPKESYAKADRQLEMVSVALNSPSKMFYKSPEWRQLRYRALELMGNTCMLCGASPRTGAVIHVDHILPRSLYPEKAFDINNLQILCEDCNMGKSNKSDTDLRGATRHILRKNNV